MASNNVGGNYNPQLNFVRIEDLPNVNSEATQPGDNSFFLNARDVDNGSTGAHEMGHGLGLKHDPDGTSILGQPDIMATVLNLVGAAYSGDGTASTANPPLPNGKPSLPEHQLDKNKRKVSEKNISDVKGMVQPTYHFDNRSKRVGNSSNNLYNSNGKQKDNSGIYREAQQKSN